MERKDTVSGLSPFSGKGNHMPSLKSNAHKINQSLVTDCVSSRHISIASCKGLHLSMPPYITRIIYKKKKKKLVSENPLLVERLNELSYFH